MQNEKSFEIGGLKFSAIRQSRPIAHWRIRTDENGVVFEAGAGGISTKSVPKMIADVEELFTRLAKGDIKEFRRHMGLPPVATSAGVS
jgi:hypothetical protein